jgi:hypothetical protein
VDTRFIFFVLCYVAYGTDAGSEAADPYGWI